MNMKLPRKTIRTKGNKTHNTGRSFYPETERRWAYLTVGRYAPTMQAAP